MVLRWQDAHGRAAGCRTGMEAGLKKTIGVLVVVVVAAAAAAAAAAVVGPEGFRIRRRNAVGLPLGLLPCRLPQSSMQRTLLGGGTHQPEATGTQGVMGTLLHR